MKQLFILLLLSCNLAFSQINFIDPAMISENHAEHNYITLKENIQVRPSDILNTENTTGLRVSNLNSFNIVNSKTDPVGNLHYQCKQYYNGIPVEGSMLKLHCNSGGFVKSLNGKIFNISGLNITPGLNTQSAVQYAMNNFTNTVFAWQDTASESRIKIIKENPNATNYPSPELCVYEQSGNFYLTYKMFIETSLPKGSWEVLIDALSGQLRKKEMAISACYGKPINSKSKPLTKNDSEYLTQTKNDVSAGCSGGCYQASGSTLYYGYQYIFTDKYKPNPIDCKYRLKNTCTGTFIYTRNADNGNIKEYSDQTTNWSYYQTEPGVTAHWCMERVHDYFRFTHNQNSFDNQFSQINVFTNVKYKFPNGAETDETAFFKYSDNTINLGKGKADLTNNDYTTLDIIGHEFSHGIDKYHGDIYGLGESGAIEESYGDIFGCLTEHYTKSNFAGLGSGNYLSGEEIFKTGAGRSLMNPKSFGHPDTYGETNWVNTQDLSFENDLGGIHANCGVQNYWFYLLCEGGSDTNDKGNLYCVKPIGKDKAGKIAYHTLTNYLGGNITYSNARFYSIQAASDLYGAASDEVAQVTAAWYAVGVGGPFTGQVNYSNQTVNSQTDIHYNSKVSLQNVTANAPSLYVTSNTEIELINDVNLNAGSWVELYIAPVSCSGAARLINPNGDGSGRGQTANATTQSNSARSAVPVILNENDSRDNTYIQPNPSNGVFTLLLNENRETPQSVTVLDYQGKVVKEFSTINRHELDVNITELNTGIYFVKITYPDAVLLKKIVKN